MSHVERCPHCLIPPMRPMTNGWGGVFLSCLDCGYSEPVMRRPDPAPVREYIDANGKLRRRYGRIKEVRNLIPKIKPVQVRGAPKARRLKTSKPKRRAA